MKKVKGPPERPVKGPRPWESIIPWDGERFVLPEGERALLEADFPNVDVRAELASLENWSRNKGHATFKKRGTNTQVMKDGKRLVVKDYRIWIRRLLGRKHRDNPPKNVPNSPQDPIQQWFKDLVQ